MRNREKAIRTIAAAQVARRLGATWLGVDDLRLALERTGVQVPDSRLVAEFDAPGGLVADLSDLRPRGPDRPILLAVHAPSSGSGRAAPTPPRLGRWVVV